ncbi:MAG: diguanylate cyclase [Desulfobacterales bacterium]|nr:diguanylate cyclase [Desulfobacterales bacterium]
MMKDMPQTDPRVLIVDDERLNINILNDTLKHDYRIKVAVNGTQALERAVSHPRPDIILLDIIMPDMDGFTVCRQLKSNPSTAGIPVIFITAKSEERDEIKGLELGGADFISKPIRPDIVRARVKTHVTALLQKRQLERMHEKVLALSAIDGLTGIANRRRFDEFLIQEWSRSRRSGTPTGLLMMDIDHFKYYNDHYGHVAGDACLKRIAETVSAQVLRPPDMAARYGGEEFVCLLPDTGLSGVGKVGTGILEAVRALGLPHVTSPTAPMVTLSIGGTAVVPDESMTHLEFIDAADNLLYQVKQNGRNNALVQGIG